MQTGILDLLAGNLAVVMALFATIIVVLLTVYIKTYAKIIPPGAYYRFYRKGILMREGTGGTMVIRIPFLDRLEIIDPGGEPFYVDRLDPSERSIRKERTVDADLDEVWNAWTTTEGAESFFAPRAKVDLRIGGQYEMYFVSSAPIGQRGGEGLRILSYLPKEMLSFEWNAPPQFGKLRGVKTWVVLQFQQTGIGRTSVTLTHCGWGEGEEWNQVYEYFDSAWDRVLDNLHRRFSEGAIDW